MFDDVNRSIESLVRSELPPDVAAQVKISFVTPDESFPPQGLTLPAVNFFLFEIRENMALRETQPALERTADGSVLRYEPPVLVDCHYLVTAVASQAAGPEAEEHRILGAVLKILLRYRRLPEAALRGALVGTTPPLRASVLRPASAAFGMDLWQALKAKPRASLHYALTVPVDVASPQALATPVCELRLGVAE